MQPVLKIAIKAARRAGSIILRHANRLDTLNIENKGRNDFVSEVDHMAEQDIINTIRQAYPDHAILAEESGSHQGNNFEWVIDPLDGTTNFLHGYPNYAVSIAMKHRGKLEAAVVFDPLRDELFTAYRGEGAQLNDRRIRVSGVKRMENALLGTGFPFRNKDNLEPWIAIFREFVGNTSGVRRAGSAALDLAHVASGRLDGFWEFGLNTWDIAAGCLLIQEAGGMVSGFGGSNDFLETGNVLAGSPEIYDQMLPIIKNIHTG
ncbi:MAG: inositol monophosphatase [Gammaproteobacteria bacterium]|nr:inositol monophosphatase [Gammaproteobacteria bacterium]